MFEGQLLFTGSLAPEQSQHKNTMKIKINIKEKRFEHVSYFMNLMYRIGACAGVFSVGFIWFILNLFIKVPNWALPLLSMIVLVILVILFDKLYKSKKKFKEMIT